MLPISEMQREQLGLFYKEHTSGSIAAARGRKNVGESVCRLNGWEKSPLGSVGHEDVGRKCWVRFRKRLVALDMLKKREEIAERCTITNGDTF